MLKHPRIREVKFPRLRHGVSGGAAMPVEVLNQWEEITGKPIYEGYGLTETTVSLCINRPEMKKIGSIGRPYPGVHIKIVDDNDVELPTGEVGELIVKSPNVMLGYLNKPEETAEAMRNGWFHTGDLGYVDEDGYLFIVDRKKDMIIKGGFNIYPREIEEVIYALPEVAEAAVIGIYDEAKGELVRACIAFKPGKSLSEDEVRNHLANNLAKYKLPNDYVFLDELPKGPTGKLLKRELRGRWEQWNKDRLRPQKAEAAASS
jgi:long-chain acyl-CoA synthetase